MARDAAWLASARSRRTMSPRLRPPARSMTSSAGAVRATRAMSSDLSLQPAFDAMRGWSASSAAQHNDSNVLLGLVGRRIALGPGSRMSRRASDECPMARIEHRGAEAGLAPADSGSRADFGDLEDDRVLAELT